MPKRRGFFEFIKDILVSATAALGAAIETFYKSMTKSAYEEKNNELSKLLKILEEYSKKSEDKEEFFDYTNKEDKTKKQEYYKSFDEYKKALTANVKNVISENIDEILSPITNFSQIFMSGERDYRLTTSYSENVTHINVMDCTTNKMVYMCDFSVTKDEKNQNQETYTNEGFCIKNLKELGIIDESITPYLTEKQFFEGVQKMAEQAFQQEKKFFEFNGHIFSIRKDATQQFVVFDAKSKLVGKWSEGASLFNNGYIPIKNEKRNDAEKKDFVKLLFLGEKVLEDKVPETKEEFENNLKKQGVIFKSQQDDMIYATFFDKKKQKNINIEINTKTCKTTNRETQKQQWIPTFTKIYILNNLNKISEFYNNPNFDIQQFTEKLKNKNNDLSSLKQDLIKCKTMSELINANESVANSDSPYRDELLEIINTQYKNKENAVLTYIKTKEPNDKNEIVKALSFFDNIDSLSNLNYLIKTNKLITPEQKNIFAEAFKERMLDLQIPNTKITLNENIKTSDLQMYKMYHLDKAFVQLAEEKIDDIIKDVVKLVDGCQKLNQAEKCEIGLTSIFAKIDDLSTFKEMKATVENDIVFFASKDVENSYNKKCHELEAELYYAEFKKTQSIFSKLSFEEALKQSEQIPDEIKESVLKIYNDDIEKARDDNQEIE